MKIEFYYDFGSPNAYLVHKTLPEIAKTYGVPIISRPILLGGVFKATNNKSPMEAFANVAGKLAYEARETERFVENHKIIFQLNPHFPVNTIALMRGAIFALGKPWEQSYRDTMFHAMWVDQEKMDDPVTAPKGYGKSWLARGGDSFCNSRSRNKSRFDPGYVSSGGPWCFWRPDAHRQ